MNSSNAGQTMGIPLIDQLADIEPGDGRTANSLLSEFFRGRPIRELIPALQSTEDRVVRHASWIASELGENGSELLEPIRPLLQHNVTSVRCSALNVVLNCVLPEHGKIVAAALRLVDDESTSVRKLAYYFCAKIPRVVLEVGIANLALKASNLQSVVITELPLLLTSAATVVRTLVDSDISQKRVVGAIAAARLGQDGVEIMRDIDARENEALQGFVKDWLEDYEARDVRARSKK